MYERLRRLPRTNRARAVTERQRPAEDRCFRSTARATSAATGLDDLAREPLVITPEVPPWRHRESRVYVSPDLCEKVRKKDHTPEELRLLTDRTLAALPTPTVAAYTDGSVLRPDIFSDA